MTTNAANTGRVKRPKRGPIGEKRRTFTFRLSDDVRERVEASAAAAGRSVSEELEWRVQRSLDEEERLLQRFTSADNLNVFAAISSSWKAISIFSGKDWSEDAETLDLCKKSATNIISWMKPYKISREVEKPAASPPTSGSQSGGLNSLEALGLDYLNREQKSIKQDRLSWEAARWAIGLCTDKPDMKDRQNTLIDAAKFYRDENERFEDFDETGGEAVRRRSPEGMRLEHSKLDKDQ